MIYISPWFVHIIKQSNMREKNVICKTIIILYSMLANCLRILEFQWKKKSRFGQYSMLAIKLYDDSEIKSRK